MFFDNLQVTHTRGPLLEENHYYANGLLMAGISSRSFGKLENRYKYNGNEKQDKEFSDGSGLEIYDANFRQRDPQLGRWWQLDPMMEAHPNLSPYATVNNNPILYSDPLGLDTVKVFGAGQHKIQIRQGDVLSMTIQNTTSYYTYDPSNKEAVNGFVGAGMEQDDVRQGESAVTVTSSGKGSGNSKTSGGSSYSGLGLAGIGLGASYGESKMFNSNSWFNTGQMKSYSQRYFGNQYQSASSVNAAKGTARSASRGFRYLGWGMGLYNQVGIWNDYSGSQFGVETGVNLYSTFGGVPGAAAGIGWELGKIVTQTDWYNQYVRPSLQDTYRMFGIKIDGDPDFSLIKKIPTGNQ